MKKSAFTLVELIVGITISMILMTGIGVFVGGGISNLTQQEKLLDNNEAFGNFSYELQNTFSRIDTSIDPLDTTSGKILKTYKEFDKGGFAYIGTETLSGAYCASDSEQTNTKHIFIKNFIPFEEKDENIFTDYSKVLTGSIGSYTSYQKEHVIKDSSGNIVVGKGVFGDKFIEGGNGIDIYLNSPTGLASDGGDLLFISDTLNHRVLAYDTNSKKIYKILDEKDGLDEPTGLYYDNTEKALYIANSAKGEVLKYSSKVESTNPPLTLSFSGVTASITNFKVEFFNSSGNPNLSGPNSVGDISFIGLSKNTDFLTGSTNSLSYYFSNYGTFESTINPGPSISGCTSIPDKYYLEGFTPKLKRANCTDTNTGTIDKYNGDITQSLNLGTTYNINISNISPLLSGTGTYYTKLSLYDGNILKYEKYFPYFVQGDNDLLTIDDNTLEIITSNLNYPTGIWGPSNYNEFLDDSYNNLSFDSDNDYKLETPIFNLDIDYSDKLLNLDLKYYKQFNCYNLDDKVERSFMLKKSFR
ncbi:MAG: prepilin-type N-terminal cleavage/methylation domain-containing protein [Candidatus Gracilibacteria bacterium]|nr:prepilin-type N-terminal cleavage/methylation domain-containing protein [Candidatus Gracilibacteria bacterium]